MVEDGGLGKNHNVKEFQTVKIIIQENLLAHR